MHLVKGHHCCLNFLAQPIRREEKFGQTYKMAIYDQKCKLSKRTNRQISLALLWHISTLCSKVSVNFSPPANFFIIRPGPNILVWLNSTMYGVLFVIFHEPIWQTFKTRYGLDKKTRFSLFCSFWGNWQTITKLSEVLCKLSHNALSLILMTAIWAP
jgi:hypothetical protein